MLKRMSAANVCMREGVNNVCVYGEATAAYQGFLAAYVEVIAKYHNMQARYCTTYCCSGSAVRCDEEGGEGGVISGGVISGCCWVMHTPRHLTLLVPGALPCAMPCVISL